MGFPSPGCSLPAPAVGDRDTAEELVLIAFVINHRTVLGVGHVPDNNPGKELIDAVDPDRAVVLMDQTDHNYWLSSKGPELAGIYADTPTNEVVIIEKDPVTGDQREALAKRRSSDDLGAPKMGLAKDSPANLPELIEAASRMDMKRTAFSELLDEVQREMERREVEIRMICGEGPLTASERNKLDDKLSAMRREVRAESDDARYTLLREMGALDKAVSAVGEMYASPNQMLLLEGLGTSESLKEPRRRPKWRRYLNLQQSSHV